MVQIRSDRDHDQKGHLNSRVSGRVRSVTHKTLKLLVAFNVSSKSLDELKARLVGLHLRINNVILLGKPYR